MTKRSLPALGCSPLAATPDLSRVARVLEKIEVNCHYPRATSRYTVLANNPDEAKRITEDGQRALRTLLNNTEIKELFRD